MNNELEKIKSRSIGNFLDNNDYDIYNPKFFFKKKYSIFYKYSLFFLIKNKNNRKIKIITLE